MNLDQLKEKFLEKYGDCLFLEETPKVIVVLPYNEYKELSEDLEKMFSEMNVIELNEATPEVIDPNEIMYLRIGVGSLCDFIVEMGDSFEMKMYDESKEYGDEKL